MTIVVANRATGEMASDLQATHGDLKYTAKKIYPIGRSLIGAAGTVTAICKFVRWMESGGKSKTRPEFDKKDSLMGMVLNPAGIFMYDTALEPDEIEDDFVAIGTGAAAALGALYAGADVKRAVEIASRLDPSCGRGIEIYTLGGAHVRETE